MKIYLIILSFAISLNVFAQAKKTVSTAATSTTTASKSSAKPATATVISNSSKAIAPSPTVILKKVPTDTLIKLGGRKIPIFFKQQTANQITYALIAKPDSFIKIDIKEVEWIIYKSGAKKMYNKPVLSAVTDDQWQTVMIVKDRKQTEGLYKVGYVEARTKPQKSKQVAFSTAVTMLQRKAIVFKAYIVLIEEETYPGAYGDPPVCYLAGSCWGLEPLEKGTNTMDEKNKK